MKVKKAEVRLFIRVPAIIKTNLMAAAKKKKVSLADVVRASLVEYSRPKN